MIFSLGAARIKTTLQAFNNYVLHERHNGEKADMLLMSFDTFGETDLANELAGDSGNIQKIAQLSRDDNCTVFCGLKTTALDNKQLSVLTAHKGEVCDIVGRTFNFGYDEYKTCRQLKVYNTFAGKVGVLVDTDATLFDLWTKIKPAADFVFCFSLCEDIRDEVKHLADFNKIPTVFLSPQFSDFFVN